MVGRTLGHYRIEEKIGAGGMGVVYRAHDTQLGRDVALKVLPVELVSDKIARGRLLNEARAASALNHAHICAVHEVGESDGMAYIAMEYVAGRPLDATIHRDGLASETVVRYGAQIADALGHAHRHGVIHRDLKASNVVITPEASAKVLDFGLAKRVRKEELAEATVSQATLEQAGAVAGTLPYMAPEVLRGEPSDEQADIWSLGVLLYEMATGARPFGGRTGFELTSAILRDTPAALGTRVPAGLAAVILRCLAKEPALRYQRASEVRVALETLTAERAVVAGRAPRRHVALGVTLLGLLALVALVLGFNAGGWRDRLLGRAAAPRIESLAVLPLENLSRDPEQEYFADGMTEALITDLSKVGALKVISRTSVMRYKRTDKALPQIARELGVDAVIEGSVLREGDQVRITVQLIHGATDKHLWADNYQREFRSILALQSEVARAITQQIRVTLTPRERARLASARPVNPEGHEAYLKGHYYLQKFSPDGMKNAIAYFNQAIEKDPSNALAYAGLSRAYRAVLSPKEGTAKARAAAEKALVLDDTLAEAHTALANIKFSADWDFFGADSEYKRAIELGPGYGEAHHMYSHYLASMGRFNESELESRRYLQLDPLSTASNVHLGWHYLVTSQYDQAIEQYQKSVEMDPNFLEARFQLGQAYLAKKMYQKAIAELQKAIELSQGRVEQGAELGYAYGVSGNRSQAQKVLSGLLGRAKGDYVSPYAIAKVYVGLDEKAEALAWLERAYKEHSPALVGLKVEFEFEPLRLDPRFHDLLRRMNFPD